MKKSLTMKFIDDEQLVNRVKRQLTILKCPDIDVMLKCLKDFRARVDGYTKEDKMMTVVMLYYKAIDGKVFDNDNHRRSYIKKYVTNALKNVARDGDFIKVPRAETVIEVDENGNEYERKKVKWVDSLDEDNAPEVPDYFTNNEQQLEYYTAYTNYIFTGKNAKYRKVALDFLEGASKDYIADNNNIPRTSIGVVLKAVKKVYREAFKLYNESTEFKTDIEQYCDKNSN